MNTYVSNSFVVVARWTLAALVLSLSPFWTSAAPLPGTEPLPSALVVTEMRSARGEVALARIAGGRPQTVALHPSLARGTRFSLDLPNGATVTIVRERLEDLGGGDFVWVGQVEGHAFSRVTLTSRQGVSSGIIDLPWQDGNEYYEIVPQGRGGSVLAKGNPLVKSVDDTLIPPLPEMTSARTGSRGARLASRDNVTLATDEGAATELNPAVVDVMVVYSTASMTRYGQGGIEGKILTAVADANTAHRNSQVHVLFNLVHMAEVNDGDTTGDINGALNRLVNPADGFMDEVPGLRDQYKADVVALVGEYTGAGLGYVMTVPTTSFAPYALSATSSDYLWYFTMHHEIGHNMGNQHDRPNASYAGAYPYAYGYQWCTTDGTAFRTIMSYACATAYAPRLNYISNPNILINGLPAGVSYESSPATSADNARSMNLTGPVVQQFRTGTPVPVAPSTLNASVAGATQANLSWTDNSENEAGFRLERSTDAVAWSVIATLPANTTAFTDAGLAADTTYYYRVRAYNGGGFSGYSNTADVSTVSNPPTAPSDLNASAVSECQINLVWTDSATNEQGVRVERSISGGGWSQAVTLPANTKAWADPDVAAGTEYTYRVIAFNAAGDSEASNTSSATPQLPPAPSAPANLSVTATSPTQVNLAWSDTANNETSQQLERSLDNGVTWASLASLSANVTVFQDTGLAALTCYSYRIRACNSGGCSDFSVSATATTLPNPPAAPTGLSATAVSQTEINLSWGDNATTEIGFRVERSPNGTIWTLIASLTANTTAYADVGLSAGMAYSYRVRAYNNGGESLNSNVATATTPPNPPTAPTGLLATAVSQTQINLVWGDNATTEAGFRLERSVANAPWTLHATLGANVTFFTDIGLLTGTTYAYRVQAYNASGGSAWSNTAETETFREPTLNPPLNLSAVAVSYGLVDLTWTDNNTSEDGFEVQRSTAGQSWTPVAWIAPNATAYRDAGLAAQTAYNYRVLAFSGADYSAASASVSVTTSAFVPSTATTSSNSVGTEDGYVLESGETTSIGGALSAGKGYVGDSSKDYQYRSVFSFDTSGLPDGATITSAQLRLNVSSVSGTWPWQTHGVCWVDVKSGAGFGGSTALAKTDFEAAADATGVASLSAVTANGQWSQGTLNAEGMARINTTGKTQFRVYFQRDDNDDASNDYVIFNTGGASTASLRPQLIVTYQSSVTAPAAPTSLGVKPVSVTQLGLTWVDNAANETGFRVERSLDGASWVEIALLAANTTAFTDAGLAEGTTYEYRVRSYNDSAQSAYSTVASGTPSNPPIVLTFNSLSTEDGYVLESGETTGVGGSIKIGTAYIGDDRSNKQYQSVFSFDTSGLPDGALIVSAKLRLKVAAVSGTSPWQTHGACQVDLKGGSGFSGSTALATGDFAATADVVNATSLPTVSTTGQWSEGMLTTAGQAAINTTGRTQFRVHFQLDDNNDKGADYVSFSTGGASIGSKPELVIEYFLP